MKNNTLAFVEYWFISSGGKITFEYEEMTEIKQLSTLDNFDEIKFIRKPSTIIVLNNVVIAVNER